MVHHVVLALLTCCTLLGATHQSPTPPECRADEDGSSLMQRGQLNWQQQQQSQQPQSEKQASVKCSRKTPQNPAYPPLGKFPEKVVMSSKEAVSDIASGSTLLIGGWGPAIGTPMALVRALVEHSAENLTLVSGIALAPAFELSLLSKAKLVVTSYISGNAELTRQWFAGKLELELLPMGTFVEKVRAGSAGIPAFFTPAGVGTLIQEGGFPIKYFPNGSVAVQSAPKEAREFGGKSYLMEEAISSDYALVMAWKADRFGNLMFRGTARNFNLDMAKAGRITIAQVEEIVEALTPEETQVPGIYVDRLLLESCPEALTSQPSTSAHSAAEITIAKRAALELQDGMYVNLGAGLALLASSYVPVGVHVVLQSENGLLGMGPPPPPGEDPDVTNAGGQPTTYYRGSSFFSSSESFLMIRGGHLELTLLGALQVSQNGDLASWMVPGGFTPGMGGAMDLVSNPERTRVVVTTTQLHGAQFKLVKNCTFPLTGRAVISRVITEMAVFDFRGQGALPLLVEIVHTTSVDVVRRATGFDFEVADPLATFQEG